MRRIASALVMEWQLGGRVEVPWAGIAVTFPDTWEASVDADPGTVDARMATTVLSAFDETRPGVTACFVLAYRGNDFDWTTADSQADADFECGFHGNPASDPRGFRPPAEEVAPVVT